MQPLNRETQTTPLEPSELVLNPDGSVYHLNLKPEHIADKVIVVGDQNRVKRISSRFSSIEHQIEKREFVTHTGSYKGKRLTVLSTGIGTDNIDIVINELDALVNIDLKTRIPKEKHHPLEIIRLGTSGALCEDIPVDSFVTSTYGLGLDGVMHFYDVAFEEDEQQLVREVLDKVDWPKGAARPYAVKSSSSLFNRIARETHSGITVTAHGFYGPQGRALRLPLAQPNFNELLRKVRFQDQRITNYEMETSALFGLSSALGHEAATVCAIIANRYRKEYSKDYQVAVEELIDYLLEVV